MIEIIDSPIDEATVLNSARTVDAGAVVLFVGMTRRMTGERETVSLEYEAYHEMAIRQIERLANDARAKWPLLTCSIVHRIGSVPIGQTSIAVAVGSAHRADAFAAAGWIMDTLKREVPIWKKEIWADGKCEWIHPIENARAQDDEYDEHDERDQRLSGN